MVLPFFALVIPLLLGMGALVVDGGRYYVRYAQLEHLARSSAESVLGQVGLDLVALAEESYYEDCFVEEPPPRCSGSSDWRDFLTRSEIDQYVYSAGAGSMGRARGVDFATRYDPDLVLRSEDIMVEYPYGYMSGSGVIKARVSLRSKPDLWLEHFRSDEMIVVESMAHLPLW